jgi:hypothetical protein
LQIATAPTANGMAVTVEFLGHLKMRRVVRCRRPSDQPATQDQGLWGGMGSHDRLQMGLFIASYGHLGSKRNGHCRDPYDKGEMAKHDMTMPPVLHIVYAKTYWRRIYEMDIYGIVANNRDCRA